MQLAPSQIRWWVRLRFWHDAEPRSTDRIDAEVVNARVTRDHQALPIGPLRWINGNGGTRAIVAVGSVNGEQRRVEVASLPGGNASKLKNEVL